MWNNKKRIIKNIPKYPHCHNLNFGLVTKAMVCKGVGQEWNSRVTFHVLSSEGKWERMNSHTPKWGLTLRDEVLMEFRWTREFLECNYKGQNSLD
jgi:hypothetical protein